MDDKIRSFDNFKVVKAIVFITPLARDEDYLHRDWMTITIIKPVYFGDVFFVSPNMDKGTKSKYHSNNY